MLHRNAVAIVLLLNGCHSAGPLPAVPELSTASFLPAIRQEVEAALAAAKARPGDAAATGRLGMVLQAHNQFETARRCYQRASLMEPRNFDWQYYLGMVSDGAAAVEAFRAALRLRDYLPARLRLGEALLALGDSAAACDVFRGLQHPAALFGYGRAAQDPAYFEKALASFPEYGAALFALAQHYQRTGRSADAQRLMADYSRFKLVAPHIDDPLLYNVRALNLGPDKLLSQAASLESQGQLAGAVELHKKALELDPRLTQAHVNLISLYGRLGKVPEAEEHYREALTLDSNAYEAYYNFGVLCYASNRRGEAQAAFEKVLAINPNHADGHNNLGALREEQGKLDEAGREFQRAIELQPGLRLAHYHLGRIYANRQQWAPAIEEFRRAVEVDDEATPTYLYALGATQARSGDTAGAVTVLGAARKKALARGQSALAASIDRDLAKLNR